VDLGRVVGLELLGVLQGGDPREQQFVVRIGNEQVLSEADALAVVSGDIRPERGVVSVLCDPEAL